MSAGNKNAERQLGIEKSACDSCTIQSIFYRQHPLISRGKSQFFRHMAVAGKPGSSAAGKLGQWSILTADKHTMQGGIYQ